MSNYSKVKDIILKLNSEELLKEKLYIVGGTVPYLISNTMSNREHSDIDIIVAANDMNVVREYLKNNNLYIKDFDSIRNSLSQLYLSFKTRVTGSPFSVRAENS